MLTAVLRLGVSAQAVYGAFLAAGVTATRAKSHVPHSVLCVLAAVLPFFLAIDSILRCCTAAWVAIRLPADVHHPLLGALAAVLLPLGAPYAEVWDCSAAWMLATLRDDVDHSLFRRVLATERWLLAPNRTVRWPGGTAWVAAREAIHSSTCVEGPPCPILRVYRSSISSCRLSCRISM